MQFMCPFDHLRIRVSYCHTLQDVVIIQKINGTPIRKAWYNQIGQFIQPCFIIQFFCHHFTGLSQQPLSQFGTFEIGNIVEDINHQHHLIRLVRDRLSLH